MMRYCAPPEKVDSFCYSNTPILADTVETRSMAAEPTSRSHRRNANTSSSLTLAGQRSQRSAELGANMA
jgi:hypothetical protein